jgi:hypothetical protein
VTWARARTTATLLLSLATAVHAKQTQTGVEERRNAAVTLLTGEIERVTGPVDRHCGIFVLSGDPSGPPPATRKQIQAAVRCVLEAKRQRRAAWAVWQVAGVDATVFDGLAVTRFSDPQLVEASGNGAELQLRPCLRPRVDDDGVVVCRNTPVDAGGVAKALDRLRDDVRRGLGKDAGAVVDREAAPDGTATGISPDAAFSAAAARVREVLRATTGTEWPICPLHRDHALELHDQHWLCRRDAAFVAPLGKLRRLRPARPLP